MKESEEKEGKKSHKKLTRVLITGFYVRCCSLFASSASYFLWINNMR